MTPHSSLAYAAIDETILNRIGRVTTEWAWVERLMGELLAYMCKADASRMYVITQNVSSSAVNGWLATLSPIVFQRQPDRLSVVVDLLKDIDLARNERNDVVHGSWRVPAALALLTLSQRSGIVRKYSKMRCGPWLILMN